MSDVDNGSAAPVFRVAKRRKVMLRRQDAREDEFAPATADVAASPSPMGTLDSGRESSASILQRIEASDRDVSVAELLRRRKQGKARRAGIEFTSDSGQQRANAEAMVTEPQDSGATSKKKHSAIEVAANRFAPQTGQVVDELDKHM